MQSNTLEVQEETTLDVASEEIKDEAEDKVCRILSRDGQVILQLNSQYYVLSPAMAGAYGCSMIVFGYLEHMGIQSSEGETNIDANMLADAMSWALDSMKQLSDPSSSLKINEPAVQEEEPLIQAS